jgi:hypothetical protein
MVSDDGYVLDEDVAMAEDDSDDIGEQAGPEKGHHDCIYEGEVARCLGEYLLFTLKPNISVISSCGKRLHQM